MTDGYVKTSAGTDARKVIDDDFKGFPEGAPDPGKNIIKLQLTLKTGLSLSGYSHDSADSPEDVRKVVTALRGPEFGLSGFPFEKYCP